MKKNIFGIILLLGITANLFGADITIDLDNKLCTANCNNSDYECKASLSICKTMVDYPTDVLSGELVKYFTSYMGGVMVKASREMAYYGLKSSTDEALNTFLYYFGKSFSINNGVKKIKGLDPATLIDFTVNYLYDVSANVIIDGLSNKQLESIRDMPIIPDRAPNSDLRQALKWVFKVLFNDLKATLYFNLKPPRVDLAVGAGVVDNTLILTDITIKNAQAANDYFDSKTALYASQKNGQIIDLVSERESTYHRMVGKEYKEDYISKFLADCKKIQLDTVEYIIANTSGFHVGDKINENLRNKCSKEFRRMVEDEKDKNSILALKSSLSRSRYGKLIKYYFPNDTYDWYMKNYDKELNYKANRDYTHLKYLNDNDIYPVFVSLNKSDSNYIGSNITVLEFFYALTKIDKSLTMSKWYYIEKYPNELLTFNKAAEILDHFAVESFKLISNECYKNYVNYNLYPFGVLRYNKANSLMYKEYKKTHTNWGHLGRVYIQIAGHYLINKYNWSTVDTKKITGAGAIDLLYAYKKTLEHYKGRN